MEKKTFDAVKMVREIRDRTAEDLKGLSVQERMAYYRKNASAVHSELDKEEGRERKKA
jgi:hypothetical protein